MKNEAWGSGPWDTEPDEECWLDPVSGYTCVVARHAEFGSVNGYVRVPAEHSDHGADYDSVPVDVHGGLTYAAPHRPLFDPDGGWWFGFDTAHAWDLVPAFHAMRALRRVEYGLGESPDVYRDFAYVRAEVVRLAQQLHARATGDPNVGD